MRLAFVATLVLAAVIAVALAGIVFDRSAGRVLEALTVAAPVFLVLGWALGRIGRATAEETVARDWAAPTAAESAPAGDAAAKEGETAPGGAAPQGT
jgi:prolipoprotein diacylglyceryltransferase